MKTAILFVSLVLLGSWLVAQQPSLSGVRVVLSDGTEAIARLDGAAVVSVAGQQPQIMVDYPWSWCLNVVPIRVGAAQYTLPLPALNNSSVAVYRNHARMMPGEYAVVGDPKGALTTLLITGGLATDLILVDYRVK